MYWPRAGIALANVVLYCPIAAELMRVSGALTQQIQGSVAVRIGLGPYLSCASVTERFQMLAP